MYKRQLVYQCEKAVKDAGDKIDDNTKSMVETEVNKVKEALKGTDSAAIKAATDELQEKFYAVAQQMYQQANPQGDPNAQQGAPKDVYKRQNYRFEVKDMFIERNKSDLIKVVQERPITCYYKAKGNIYVETQYDNVDTFRISRDGVYSVDVAIPADSDDEHIIICDLWKDKLVLWTRNRLICLLYTSIVMYYVGVL